MTPVQLREVFPKAPEEWLVALADELAGSPIDTPNEVASFLAQLHHESNGLTRFEESLYYSTPERLVEVFPHRFGIPDVHGTLPGGKRNAYEYVRAPEKLANYIYDDAYRSERYKLGNDKPGDGWRYRGMGPPQITGKNNYRRLSEALGIDLVAQPELLKTPVLGVQSAIWFWREHGMDAHDDDLDVRAETKILQGGELGLKQRQQLFDRIQQIQSVPL